MDKYELNIKLEQMRKLIRRKEYNTASRIADTIEWNRIKSNQDLLMAADVYEASGKLVNAREVLLYAYERTNLGRQIVYRLCRVATKLGDIDEAEEFYSEFVRMATGDNSKYILQYEIARARGNNLDTQIAILSKYLDEEMDDRWAYELAKLYHKAGKGQDCAKMCDTIILWFSDGKYVDRALELKSLYSPLTKEQQSRVFKESIIPVIDRTDEVEDAKMILNEMQGINAEEIKVTDYSNKVGYDTVNIQKALAESMKDVFGEEDDKKSTDDLLEEMDVKADADKAEIDSLLDEIEEVEAKENLEKTKEVNFGATKVFVPISKQMLGEAEEIDISSNINESVVTEENNDVDEEKIDVEQVVEEKETEEVAAEPEEEIVDEDHIEGQVTIDEVLAMFNLDVDEEANDETSEEIKEESVQEEEEVTDIESETEEVSEAGSDIEEAAETEDVEDDIEENEDLTLDSLAEEIAELIDEAEEAMDVTEEVMEEAFDETEMRLEEESDDELEIEPEQELEEQQEIELEEPSEEIDSEVESEENIEEDGEEVGEENEEVGAIEAVDTIEEVDAVEEVGAIEEVGAVEKIGNEEHEDKGYVKRNLSPDAKKELKDFISRFTGVKGIDKQILKAMHSVLRTSADESNFIFIIGDVKSGKTTLAIDIIKVLNKIMENRGRKIAKVPGSSLGGKNMDKFMEKVEESDIVVEKVSSMGEDSLKELVKAVKKCGESKIVIFEDEVITSEKFVRGICEKINVGDNIIVLKQSRIKEWAEIAKDYIKEEGYEIDEMGILAMHERIDKLHALTLVIQKNHVEQVIDRAIAKHNKKKLTNLFRGNKSNVLTEKDFIED